jgi:RES domain-containing protein
MVYTSASQSLALVEKLVHIDTDLLPDDLVYVSAEIPDGLAIERVDPARISRAWRQIPPPAALAKFGSRWIAARRTAVLRVSAVPMPDEHNYLLNPAHPDFAKIKIGKPEAFTLDPRLKK